MPQNDIWLENSLHLFVYILSSISHIERTEWVESNPQSQIKQ